MTREEVLRYFPRTQDPEILARRRRMIEITLEQYPEIAHAIQEQARRDGLIGGQVEEARKLLRRVLTLRGLLLSVEDDARIEACADLETLERWLDEAIVARSAAEVLR